jgi:hypothetical protein
MSIAEVFRELHEFGRERCGREFLRPPLPAREVDERLQYSFSGQPPELQEWFSLHNGSDRAWLVNDDIRPEWWAFGACYTLSIEEALTRFSWAYGLQELQPRAPAVLFHIGGVTLTVDIGYQGLVFSQTGRYEHVIAPSLLEYLELWRDSLRTINHQPPLGVAEAENIRGDSSPFNMLALRAWCADGSWRSSFHSDSRVWVNQDHGKEWSERRPDMALLDVGAVRRNFRSARPPSPFVVDPWNEDPYDDPDVRDL